VVIYSSVIFSFDKRATPGGAALHKLCHLIFLFDINCLRDAPNSLRLQL
jgi:hypothetical protein